MTKPPDELINSVLKKIRNLNCPDDERAELWQAATDWSEAYIELLQAARSHVAAVNNITSGRVVGEFGSDAADASFGWLCVAINEKSEVKEIQ